MIDGVSTICFAASYAVAFALEVTRLFFRVSLRSFTTIAFAAAGLLAHSMYLLIQARQGLDASGTPLSSWYHWCLIAAWILAWIYVALAMARPKNPIGLFLLPLVLALIGVAQLFPKDQWFSTGDAYRIWSFLHGMTLLLGTASVVFGFASGVMYLVQSYRLKHKWPTRQGFSLPSLEWLQGVSERSLLVSTFLLAGGLLSGILINLIQHGQRADALPWTDPLVWTSGILLLWLVAVCLFNSLYKPARQGRKVAYLTVASFVFLVMVLGILLSGKSRHSGIEPSTVRAQNAGQTMWSGGGQCI